MIDTRRAITITLDEAIILLRAAGYPHNQSIDSEQVQIMQFNGTLATLRTLRDIVRKMVDDEIRETGRRASEDES